MWEELLLFAVVGFAAQLIDGALGMAYGVSATTVLLALGVPPATASASVHTAEVFTTGASALSHWRFGNIEGRLLAFLVPTGVLGGAAGALLLGNLPSKFISPLVSAYLLAVGVAIAWRAIHRRKTGRAGSRYLIPLGFAGGLLDAIGGGGWGPIVTGSLMGRDGAPRFVIGSVNAAEFFVTTTITATFFMTIGLDLWPIIAGLILGGGLAAPLAAYVTAHVPDRPLMILVGSLIALLSFREIISLLA